MGELGSFHLVALLFWLYSQDYLMVAAGALAIISGRREGVGRISPLTQKNASPKAVYPIRQISVSWPQLAARSEIVLVPGGLVLSLE